ncbi:MAG: IclR family transcriptional regulator [Chloroflexota bacterium]|nr:IclR family transcriptional regulator [Chloroflexota bacterium]
MRTLSQNDYQVQSVQRAFEILFAFSIETPLLGSSDLARMLGINRTTVHRLLATLESCGAVRQEPLSRKYALSPRLLQLSNVVLRSSDIRAVSIGPLTRLRNSTDETAALHIREGQARIMFMQIESSQELRATYPRVGEPIPLHLGAPSKAVLASMEAVEVEEYVRATPLTGATPFSFTEREALLDELARIRERGYAVSRQERRVGIASLAAPVFDATGVVVAAINIIGPLDRLREPELEALAPLVIETAREVSHALGYSDAAGEARMEGGKQAAAFDAG